MLWQLLLEVSRFGGLCLLAPVAEASVSFSSEEEKLLSNRETFYVNMERRYKKHPKLAYSSSFIIMVGLLCNFSRR